MPYSVRALALASGSSGNSIYLESRNTSILIDAGHNCKFLENNMKTQGIDPLGLSAILLTHEHSDHMSAVSVLARKYGLAVYGTKLTLEAARKRMTSTEKIIFREILPYESFVIGDLYCRAVRVSHDSVDAVAYKVDAGKAIVSVVTDTGLWSDEMSKELIGSDLIFLEANYDEEMLWTGPYPWPLKRRVASEYGHLSNLASAEAAYKLLTTGTSRIVLIHLSKVNNTPELAYEYISHYLAERGLQSGLDYSMSVANRYEPSLWQIL